MYSGVPTTMPALVPTSFKSPMGRSSLATPKSSSFTKSGTPSFVMRKMFSGFTSRCTTPTSCAAWSARAACMPMRTVRFTEKGPRLMASASAWPSSTSITQNTQRRPSGSGSSPKCETPTMCWLAMALTARTSWVKRCTNSGSVRCSCLSTLTAAFWPVRVSVAR